MKRSRKIILVFLIILMFWSFGTFFFKLNILVENEKNTVSDIVSGEILSININKNIVYLPLEGREQLIVELDISGEVDETIIWSSSNEEVVSVEEGLLTAKNTGEATISASTLNGKVVDSKVIVTDLISLPKINSNKSYLSCNRYSLEESILLDEILESRINDSGISTRSGVIAAARFLLLEFPYTIKYFNENGRLNNHSGQSHVDGEGRYYHKGLYLHESKFETISSSKYGPGIWGCNIWDSFVSRYAPNGLTCSGFVSWTLLNGGFDVGDSGAGDTFRDDDIGDLGENLKITRELMESGKVKAGDIIGRDGHVAIIIGIDDKYIYIAEALPSTVRVVTLTKNDELLRSSNFKYIILMDEVYKDEGNYRAMWN